MRKLTALALSLILMISATGQKNVPTDSRLAGIDTALARVLKAWKVAGFAVAVVEKNKIVYSKGFGFRDYEKKLPATANTLFAIGSCTKAFTAGLLGQLSGEGKVELDNRVTEYLPKLSFFNEEMNNKLTVRDMMCHRTGLPRHDFAWYLFSTESRDSLMQRIKYQEPSAGIREKWQYNNFMFLLQGMITEKLTGESWEKNIRDKFFTPLGMTRSNTSIAELQKDADASLGYVVKDDSIIKKVPYYNIAAMGPAGSINSSVNEMAKWVITWINNGKSNGKEIIPEGYRREAIGSQMVISGGVPDMATPDIHFSNYGLGWFLASYRGHYRVEHGGNIDGFSASTCFFPSDSIGVIVLTNQNASMVTSIVRNLVVDRMLKLKYKDWNNEMKKNVGNAKTGSAKDTTTKVQPPKRHASPHPITDFAGLFVHPGYGTVDVYVKNDSLFGRTVKDSFFLRQYDYDIFEIKGIDTTEGVDTSEGGQRINFRTSESGTIESLLIALEPSLNKPIEFKSQPRAKTISKEDLEKYVGEYELEGMTTKVYIKGNTLYLFVPGQPEYETIPIGDHTFKFKILDGFSVKFEVTPTGEVPAVTIFQPQGNFKAKRKK